MQDEGVPTKFDTASVSISILDVNDHAPKFVDSPYVARVPENKIFEAQDPIFVLSAVDRDDPPFNKIEYGIRDSFDGLFSLSASTGEIFLKNSLDREEESSYSVEVTASDFGKLNSVKVMAHAHICQILYKYIIM